ncbi:hypothetical protein PS662_01586 [Pseudomonas fluorescens]|uniref:Uncharacterized protein n=1 Tax=Pseudomonas fluorescens TaxID=294 RepID=A0A5E6RF97_PSEFL|nr:hypothetical protein PS662_01586 [Pseudomonas fluorescens]
MLRASSLKPKSAAQLGKTGPTDIGRNLINKLRTNPLKLAPQKQYVQRLSGGDKRSSLQQALAHLMPALPLTRVRKKRFGLLDRNQSPSYANA